MADRMSSTNIGQIVYQYWQNHLPVLVKCLPVLTKSYTGIGKRPIRFLGIRFQQYQYTISPIPVDDYVNNGRRNRMRVLGKDQLVSLVYDFSNFSRLFGQDDFRISAIRICIIYMYTLSNLSILVDNLVNTGRRFGQYR